MKNMGNRLFLLICGGWFTVSTQLSQKTYRACSRGRRNKARRLSATTNARFFQGASHFPLAVRRQCERLCERIRRRIVMLAAVLRFISAPPSIGNHGPHQRVCQAHASRTRHGQHTHIDNRLAAPWVETRYGQQFRLEERTECRPMPQFYGRVILSCPEICAMNPSNSAASPAVSWRTSIAVSFRAPGIPVAATW